MEQTLGEQLSPASVPLAGEPFPEQPTRAPGVEAKKSRALAGSRGPEPGGWRAREGLKEEIQTGRLGRATLLSAL